MQLGHEAAALAQHINMEPRDKAKALKINLPRPWLAYSEKHIYFWGMGNKASTALSGNISRSFLRNLKTSNIQLNLPQAFILNL